MRRIFLLFLFLGPAILVRAQTVQWNPPGGKISVGQVTQLVLVFHDCRPTADAEVPKVPDLIVQANGSSSSSMYDGSSIVQSYNLNYLALWGRKEPLIIPAFQVDTDRGKITVPETRWEPAAATVGSTGRTVESATSSRLEVGPKSVWAGEVFPIEFRVKADAAYRPDFQHGPPTWNPSPLFAEDWSNPPEPFQTTNGSATETGLLYRTRALATHPGTVELQPANEIVHLNVGTTMFGFFQNPQYQQFLVPSPRTSIVVRPLPAPPPDFSGAVGTFHLASKVVPAAAGLKEPITWTLTLSGTGNWPQITALPQRSVSRDFQVVHPQVQRTPAPGKIFDASLTEDIVLVPTKAGRYVLPPVHFVYFDPAAGRYRTLTSAEGEVEIAAPAQPAPEEDAAARAAATRSAAFAANAHAPDQPHGLPREPLAASGLADLPLSAGAWLAWCLAPFLVVIGAWIGFARARALRTDPQRGRRDARERLAATLARLRAGAPPRPLLLAWQADAALLWNVRHAAPGADAFPDAGWAELWRDAETALYGRSPRLPSGWVEQAGRLLAEKPAPAFRFRQTFHRRNLFPMAAAAALAAGLAAAGAASARADAAALYQSGHYAEARAAWEARPPLDPAARHGRSLALAQERHWPEAAAQAAAAFVQRPGEPAIRGQFLAACEQADIAPGPLTRFLRADWFDRVAAWQSPAVWQRIAIGGTAAIAFALLLLLGAAYGAWNGRWLRGLSALAAALGLVAVAGGILGRADYGVAARADAVWVVRPVALRSIPTEAEGSQVTVPLTAGSIAEVDARKSFLSWRRLRFPNGTTGWVRAGDIAPLWK